ncbi:MAG: glycosyltransferase, partial [Bacteroidota bacterium]
EEVRAVPVEELFRVSEDYVRQVRLCAQHPERRIEVMPQGVYMRLLHADSLSAKASYTVEKITMHLLSMCVGGFYLLREGLLDRPQLQFLLRHRGVALRQSYGRGLAAAHLVASWLDGEAPSPSTPEAETAYTFLDAHRAEWPPEFEGLLRGPQQALPGRRDAVSAEAASIVATPGEATGEDEVLLPQVSVIIPCYNYAHYLPEAVESVLAQTYPQVEILIVNDGSTDETETVAQSLAEAHPGQVRVRNQANSGQPAHARNAGIEAVEGPYILCLDADDRLAPTFLAETVAVLEANPGLAFAYTHRQDVGAGDLLAPSGPFDPTRLYRRNYIPYCGLYRRGVWEAIGGYRTNVRGMEDWDFWVAASAAGFRGQLVPRPLFQYRRHDTGVYQDVLRDFEASRAQVILNNRSVYDTDTKLQAAETLRARALEAARAAEEAQALQAANAAAAQEGTSSFFAHIEAFQAALSAEDWARAEALAETGVAQFEEEPYAWVLQAIIDRCQGQYLRALEAVQRSLQQEESPEALIELLRITLALERPEEARQIAQRLTDRYPAWSQHLLDAERDLESMAGSEDDTASETASPAPV